MTLSAATAMSLSDCLSSRSAMTDSGVPNVSLLEPSSSRGGRRFAPMLERDLYPHALRAAATLPGAGEGVLVIPEMPSPLGIPDFVALVGGRAALERRLIAGIPPILAEADCALLAALHARRHLKVASLARGFSWDPEATEDRLLRLRNLGAVVGSPGGTYARAEVLEPCGVIYALEVKTRDWRKAIQQGRSYRTWANNYVVVLGEVGQIALARAISQAKEDSAGLFSNGCWVTRPQTRRPPLARRILGREYLVAAALSLPSLGRHEETDAL